MISGHLEDDKHSAESAGKPLSSLYPAGCAAPAKRPGAYAARDRPDKHPQQTRLQHVDWTLHSPREVSGISAICPRLTGPRGSRARSSGC